MCTCTNVRIMFTALSQRENTKNKKNDKVKRLAPHPFVSCCSEVQAQGGREADNACPTPAPAPHAEPVIIPQLFDLAAGVLPGRGGCSGGTQSVHCCHEQW